MDLLEAFDALDVIAESAELTEGTSKWKSINLDLFESGENNALYITGAPGSGKSTLAKELSVKYDAKIITLDNSWLGGIVPGDDMDRGGDWFENEFWKAYPKHKKEFDDCMAYIEAHKDDPYAAEGFEPGQAEGKGSYYDDFISYAFEYAKEHEGERFILEGIQLADKDKEKGYYCAEEMGDKPSVIFMTTPIKGIVDNMSERDAEWGEPERSKADMRKQAVRNIKNVKGLEKTLTGKD